MFRKKPTKEWLAAIDKADTDGGGDFPVGMGQYPVTQEILGGAIKEGLKKDLLLSIALDPYKEAGSTIVTVSLYTNWQSEALIATDPDAAGPIVAGLEKILAGKVQDHHKTARHVYESLGFRVSPID